MFKSKKYLIALAVIPYLAGAGFFQMADYVKQKESKEKIESLAPSAEPMGQDGMIGEVRLFAGNFAPRSWAFCHGQLLPISSNQALFSILGTTYGGDGRTTFALPDLRGRAAVGAGNGPGLRDWRLGSKQGSESTVNVGRPGSGSSVTEVARGKSTSQSSNYTSTSGLASNAVDGNTSGSWNSGSVTHTSGAGGGTSNPWWEVDLGSTYDISRIEIYNRTDCCSQRLKNFNILVDGQPFAQNQTQPGPFKTYSGNKRGRKVRIQINEKGILSLAEVKVYAQSQVAGGSMEAAATSLQPSLGMNYIICLQGTFPSRN